MFSIIHKDSGSKARTGKLFLRSGLTVETPAYVIVGTYGRVQLLGEFDLFQTKTQIVISNTYQLWRTKGNIDALKNKIATMTDSGGFQVFSLGAARSHGMSKIAFQGDLRNKNGKSMVRVTEEGIEFNDNDHEKDFNGFLTPQKSILIQEELGADIIFALDECTSPAHDKEYTKKSLELSNRWELKCLETKSKNGQFLYGIIQGGAFEDLRKESAQFIGRQNFDGFGIGGSLGSRWEEMLSILKWTIPFLPEEKPRHFLGMGTIKDVFEGVERGIDTFDCIIPTSNGRHELAWTNEGKNPLNSSWKEQKIPIDKDCDCKFCTSELITKNDLYLLNNGDGKNPEKRKSEQRMVKYVLSHHNVSFFNSLMEKIREAIKKDSFLQLKKEYFEKIPFNKM